jgi:hypothetical protein
VNFPNEKGQFFRRVLLWAAIGFAVILAAGPIMVVLTFAVLGFLVWTLFHIAYMRRHAAWRRFAAAFVAAVSWSWLHVGRLMEQAGHSGFRGAAYAAGRAWAKTRQNARFLASMVLETLGGASVGALLGYVVRNGTDALHPAVVTGAIVGAFLGILVAVSRYESVTESTARS